MIRDERTCRWCRCIIASVALHYTEDREIPGDAIQWNYRGNAGGVGLALREHVSKHGLAALVVDREQRVLINDWLAKGHDRPPLLAPLIIDVLA